MSPSDYHPIAYAACGANHFQTLDLAIAWDQAARALSADYPSSAHKAFDHAISGYKAYRQAWTKNLPASRFDDDYGRDLSEAIQSKRALGHRADSTALPMWLRSTLDQQYTQAIESLYEKPNAQHERMIVAVLARLCRVAGQAQAAERLSEWASGCFVELC
jgi:hypothetical protein